MRQLLKFPKPNKLFIAKVIFHLFPYCRSQAGCPAACPPAQSRIRLELLIFDLIKVYSIFQPWDSIFTEPPCPQDAVRGVCKIAADDNTMWRAFFCRRYSSRAGSNLLRLIIYIFVGFRSAHTFLFHFPIPFFEHFHFRVTWSQGDSETKIEHVHNVKENIPNLRAAGVQDDRHGFYSYEEV